jgi:CRISPR-associated protein Csx10
VADTLLSQLAYDEVAGLPATRRLPLPWQYKCTVCGSKTQPLYGFAEHRMDRQYASPEITFHRQTRVAINRATQTAEEGQLYSVRAVDEGTRFAGFIDAEPEITPLMRKWLPQVKFIGGRTSRGFGRVLVSVKTVRRPDSTYERIQSFNRKHRELVRYLRLLATEPAPVTERTLFTVDLKSDALIRNTDGLPTLKFDEATICDALRLLPGARKAGINPARFTLIACFVRGVQVSGWQTAWGLPKEVLLGSAMGGLYVFSVAPGDLKLDELAKLLEQLEHSGIGEMREDGYGQITICDPFHMEVNLV